MKTYIKLIVLSIFFFTAQTKAQTVGDTLQYLKNNFELKKDSYIGKPFSVLLTDLKIQPTVVWYITPFNRRNAVITSLFKFVKKEYSYNSSTVFLSISWQEEIPKDTVKYYEQKNGSLFTIDERTFYGNKIIKDIKVYR